MNAEAEPKPLAPRRVVVEDRAGGRRARARLPRRRGFAARQMSAAGQALQRVKVESEPGDGARLVITLPDAVAARA